MNIIQFPDLFSDWRDCIRLVSQQLLHLYKTRSFATVIKTAHHSEFYLQADMNLARSTMLFGLRNTVRKITSHKWPIPFAFFLTTY